MKKKRLLLIMLFVLVGFTACQHETHWFNEAETLFQQGVEQRAEKQSEAAAENFSKALLAIGRCNQEKPEVQLLKGQIEDNLGFCYWKHELFEEALPLHEDASDLFHSLNADTLLMTTLRNCGRASASLGDIEGAESAYEEALTLARTLNDQTMENDILLELSRDVLLPKGDFAQVIDLVTQARVNGAEGDSPLTLGLTYYYLEQDSLAIIYLTEAIKNEMAGVRMSAYQALCYLHQMQGDYAKALKCHKLFNENMMQADQAHRSEQMQRIKADYDLQLQKSKMQSEQKLRNLYLYLILGALLAVLLVVLLLLRQKTLNAKLKAEEMKNQMELALKKNKVYVTGLALTEQITASTLDFDLKESEWDDFVELIDKVYGNFTQRLTAQYPALTKSDLQICCLTKQGFSNQVISILMNLQTNSYARRKSRIKQEKMNGLEDDRSFEEIINGL